MSVFFISLCNSIACEKIRFFRLQVLVSPGGREATTGNTSAVRRLVTVKITSVLPQSRLF